MAGDVDAAVGAFAPDGYLRGANCLRWGGRDLPPQAGIAVHERAANGLLAAVRVYDDVEPPAVSPQALDPAVR